MMPTVARHPERYTPTPHVYRCDRCGKLRYVAREFIIAKGDEWGDGSPESFPSVCRSCHAGYEIAGEIVEPAPRGSCQRCGVGLNCVECGGCVARCEDTGCGGFVYPSTCSECGEDPR